MVTFTTWLCYEDKDPLYPVKGPILVHVLNSHYSHCAFEASFELSNETTFDQEKLLEASEQGLSSMSKQQLFQGVNPRNKWMFVQWRDWKEGGECTNRRLGTVKMWFHWPSQEQDIHALSRFLDSIDMGGWHQPLLHVSECSCPCSVVHWNTLGT